MKLPLKSGRYGALKQLLVFVGIVADEREQWSQLAGVPARIEQHSSASPTPLALNLDVNLLAATHVRLRVLPTAAGHAGVWGLRIGDGAEGAVTVSRTTSHTVTLIGDLCGPRSRRQPVLGRALFHGVAMRKGLAKSAGYRRRAAAAPPR